MKTNYQVKFNSFLNLFIVFTNGPEGHLELGEFKTEERANSFILTLK